MDYQRAVLEFHFLLTIVLWLVQDDEWNERNLVSVFVVIDDSPLALATISIVPAQRSPSFS
jgi:hypothetical protein